MTSRYKKVYIVTGSRENYFSVKKERNRKSKIICLEVEKQKCKVKKEENNVKDEKKKER